MFVFFFFKQKTAYEMRISDWSSDVCSSDLPHEEVPGRQKELVRACRLAVKPVIVATQMLDSMVNAPTPTRAEASDVATAIYDGADAVMLSAASASGAYPVEAVEMMDRLIRSTDRPNLYHTASASCREGVRQSGE